MRTDGNSTSAQRAAATAEDEPTERRGATDLSDRDRPAERQATSSTADEAPKQRAGGNTGRPGLGRPFHHLWAASGLSNLADGVLLVGVPLLAVSLTRSPAQVALVSAATTLPWLLLALHAGAIADRLDRRRIMVLAGWSRAAVLAATAVAAWLDLLSLPVLVAAVLLAGAAEVFADTSAQSALPMTVAGDRLGAANGRLIATQTLGNHFLGAPLAGLLVGVATTAVFGTAALLYAAGALLLLGMRGRFRPEAAPAQALRADIADGMRHLWGHRALRALAAYSGVLNLAYGAYFAVFVLWVTGDGSRVGLTPAQYGLLAATLAAGALAGSVLSGSLTRLTGENGALVGVTLLNALLLVVPLLLPSPLAVFPAAAGIGAANAVTNVVSVSLRQRLIPEGLLGRVNATCRLIGMGAMPLGAATAGLLATLAGLPAVFWSACVLSLLAAALILRDGQARGPARGHRGAESHE
ncbi:MFS transporter [Streptosporangium amethystogenes subsp. fukuiense]|uniref:MFS transporter n=1 Tax=Streptosporangium amethystogenes subsp. fukuiense TaxID=698418 RepID=A0ABW2SUD5_9ACTN